MAFRGGNLEGLSLRGGRHVDIVNCQAGRTCNTSKIHPQESRPLAGIYIGGGVSGDVTIVGGMSGWLWYRYASGTTNGNKQDWGVVLGTGFPLDRYFSYGLDLYGNGGVNANNPANPPGYHRGLGQQINNGKTAIWLSDAPNYGLVNRATADTDGDGLANLLEQALGLDPRNSEPHHEIDLVARDGFLTLSYPRSLAVGGIKYTVEVSTDLSLWHSGPDYTEEVEVTPLDADRELVLVRLLGSLDATQRLFARLKVEQ